MVCISTFTWTAGFAREEDEQIMTKKTTDSSPDGLLEMRAMFAIDDDGGLFAVGIELRNPSATKNIIARWPSDLQAAVLIGVADQRGKTLTTPGKIFRIDEHIGFTTVTIKSGTSYELVVPIQSRLKASMERGEKIQARVLVCFNLAYKLVDEAVSEDFKPITLKAHDMDLKLMQKSLEGDAKAKYQEFIRRRK